MVEKIILLALIIMVIHGVAFLSVPRFRDWLRKAHGIPEDCIIQTNEDNPRYDRLNVTPGILERIFFSIVVVFSVAGGVVAMIGWESLKMATCWNQAFGEGRKIDWPIEARTKMALCSLYAGLFSLSFALVSGLIIGWYFGWIK